MNRIQEYLRPSTVSEALSMLRDEGDTRMVLGGGTWLVGQKSIGALPEIEGVVDLSDIGMNAMHKSANNLIIGAMCTLTQFAEHPAIRALGNGFFVRATHNEGPVNLRNAATIGGTVSLAQYDSELYAALLAMDAIITVASEDGRESLTPLQELEKIEGIITEISIPVSFVRSGYARIARTPSDRSIVSAIAIDHSYSGARTRTALSGAAKKPLLLGAPLDPPDNIRGSAAYREAMVDIVVARANSELEKADRHAA